MYFFPRVAGTMQTLQGRVVVQEMLRGFFFAAQNSQIGGLKLKIHSIARLATSGLWEVYRQQEAGPGTARVGGF